MIYIIDLGSQYTMLIARRIREFGVYSEIISPKIAADKLSNCDGIILSGGPSSAYNTNIEIDNGIFNLGKPILGICLGMQLMAQILGGKVTTGKREYGRAKVFLNPEAKLFRKLPSEIIGWMSHGDRVSVLPEGFKSIAMSDEIEIAAMCDDKERILGLQFHPEVVHTEKGNKILSNFVVNICGAKRDWTPKSFIEDKVAEILKVVPNDKVIVGLSGGVDSAVTCALLYKAIGERCIPIFVDTGMMRSGEREEIEQLFTNVQCIDAAEVFFTALAGITDPEEKRKIIGKKFIEVFEAETKRGATSKIKGVKFLAQGTLYPDRIESKAQVGPSATIKTHHNVGGLPKKMNLLLIEPLRDLFKDEVRKVGKLLGLPAVIIERHPFPGPGLAVRIIGEVTEVRVEMLQQADLIYIEEIKKAGLYDKIWQAFAVLLPVKSVGVMGDKRSYENVVALRAVVSVDGMTASAFKFKWQILSQIGDRIVREVPGVNRVVYDITSKPPATIEWE